MVSDPLAANLAQTIESSNQPAELIRKHVQEIHENILGQSRYIRLANFTSIHPQDLEALFQIYDERFFAGRVRQALNGRPLQFRLSQRMTRAGGTTARYRLRDGSVSFEIAIASRILFDSFGESDREATVNGLQCTNRLEALQRIFEHEIIHLVEFLCWNSSKCAAGRFQEMASRLFLHRAHTHNLITRRERAAAAGIRIGSRVSFDFEGERMIGVVNRITQRVTVLVEHKDGILYSNGTRYKKFYVPIRHLIPAEHPARVE